MRMKQEVKNGTIRKVNRKYVKTGKHQALRRPCPSNNYYGIIRSANTVVQCTQEPQCSRIGPDAEGDMYVNLRSI